MMSVELIAELGGVERLAGEQAAYQLVGATLGARRLGVGLAGVLLP
jgi:hypothetical protein